VLKRGDDMVQSVLANLGVLLLMHLMINTIYHFQQQRIIPHTFVAIFHILIVTAATIAMFHFPIQMESYLFDLRLIPIIFIAYFHGWKYSFPVVILVSLYHYMSGEGLGQEIIFGTLIPSLLPMVFYFIKGKKMHITKPIMVITACWLISEIPLLSLIGAGELSLAKIAFLGYVSLIFAGLIMYFLIFFSLKHLEVLKKLQYFADHDSLTGLYNMRRFEEIIDRLTKETYQKQMFIAMIDIDYFKQINDTYGHQAGDLAIQKISKVILKYCSSHVFAARYGGDEFIMFLMTDSVKMTENTLDSIRKTVIDTTFIPLGNKEQYKLSISIGMSPLSNIVNLNKSIEHADKHLYHAKNSGRNCICG
jgi:diguanylate cyclase